MSRDTIPAQVLYDLRELYEFTDGATLGAFFARETGDPSPAGRTHIPVTNAFAFVEASYPSDCTSDTVSAVVHELWDYLVARRTPPQEVL